jgi:hypothetical protein
MNQNEKFINYEIRYPLPLYFKFKDAAYHFKV